MITINEYDATPLEVCAECAAHNENPAPNQAIGLNTDLETGEILEPHFGKYPCDLCGDTLAGHRFGATLLTKTTTTVRGN